MANFKFLETEYQLKKLKPKYNNFWYAGKLKNYWCLISVNFYEKKCSITIGAHKEDTHKSLIEILKDEPSLKKKKNYNRRCYYNYFIQNSFLYIFKQKKI